MMLGGTRWPLVSVRREGGLEEGGLVYKSLDDYVENINPKLVTASSAFVFLIGIF